MNFYALAQFCAQICTADSAKSWPFFLSIEIPGHLVMFQAVLVDLADVFAGRSSLKSPGLGLEPLIKRFFFFLCVCYCVLSLDLCVINTLGVPTSLLT